MSENYYKINKGVGRPLDFFGLKNYYILYFIVGIVVAFLSFFVIRFISEVVSYIVAGTIALASYLVSNYLNAKMGVNGMEHKLAMRSCPERVSPKRAKQLVRRTNKSK